MFIYNGATSGDGAEFTLDETVQVIIAENGNATHVDEGRQKYCNIARGTIVKVFRPGGGTVTIKWRKNTANFAEFSGGDSDEDNLILSMSDSDALYIEAKGPGSPE